MPSGDRDLKAEVLAATDLVELISQSVALKRRGKSWVGLCPFHQENTPSFHVDPVKGYFKCYGCQEHGNAIDFVIRRDRVEFLDALKSLAERAGIEAPKFGVSKHKTSERQRLLEAHSRAAECFHRQLLHPATGRAAREYLARRGFTEDTIRRFRIGFAPPGWDNLLKSSELAGLPPGLLALGGLVKARESGNGHYDTFRNRIIFPIRDEAGRVIAFGGRVMPGGDDPAKYLNSPETPLFSKGRCIYGLDFARQQVVATRTVAIVEGYTDVIMAHQFGVENVVSILGTAMTEPHLTILRRFADRIVLLFDADAAGDTAVDRSIAMYLTQPVDIAIASIPDGLDPDEFLLQRGAEAFQNLIRSAEDALSFKWRMLDRRYREAGGSLTTRQKSVESFLALIAGARGTGPVDPLRWGQVLADVAKRTEIPIAALQERFQVKPARTAGRKIRQDSASADALTRAEQWILGLVLARPSLWLHVQKEVAPERFTDPLRQELAVFYWERMRHEGETPFAELLSELASPEVKALAVNLVVEAEKITDVAATLDDALRFLKDHAVLKEQERTVASLRGASGERELEVFKSLVAGVSERDARRRSPK